MRLFKFVLAGLGVAASIVPAAAQTSETSSASEWMLIGLLIFIYLLPAIIAAKRHHNNEGAIVSLNILLGWTFLGWVAAFVWLTDNTRPRY